MTQFEFDTVIRLGRACPRMVTMDNWLEYTSVTDLTTMLHHVGCPALAKAASDRIGGIGVVAAIGNLQSMEGLIAMEKNRTARDLAFTTKPDNMFSPNEARGRQDLPAPEATVSKWRGRLGYFLSYPFPIIVAITGISGWSVRVMVTCGLVIVMTILSTDLGMRLLEAQERLGNM